MITIKIEYSGTIGLVFDSLFVMLLYICYKSLTCSQEWLNPGRKSCSSDKRQNHYHVFPATHPAKSLLCLLNVLGENISYIVTDLSRSIIILLEILYDPNFHGSRVPNNICKFYRLIVMLLMHKYNQ